MFKLSNKKLTKGFTLIELLVVIAIIGLLSSIVLASLNQARVKARDSRRMSDLHQIQLALELYRAGNGKYPTITPWVYSSDTSWNTLQTALAPYISSLPQDPINNAAGPWTTGNYSYAYYTGSFTDKYDLVAQLENVNNNYTCSNVDYKFHTVGGEYSWCHSYSYSPYLYADH